MARIKTKEIHHVLKLSQSQWPKQYVEFNTRKRREAEKDGVKDIKVLCKLMSNAVYRKTMENFRNTTDVKLVSTKNGLFKIGTEIKLYVTEKF